MECIWLEINFPNTKNFLFSVWYWPLIYIKISSEKLTKKQYWPEILTLIIKRLMTMGNWNECAIFTLFQLKEIIKTVAIVTDKTESLIDLVFTNVLFNIMIHDVYALSFSDHNLIGFNPKQNRMRTVRVSTICCRNTVNMTIRSWKIIIKMLIVHQSTCHIPFRTHYKR